MAKKNSTQQQRAVLQQSQQNELEQTQKMALNEFRSNEIKLKQDDLHANTAEMLSSRNPLMDAEENRTSNINQQEDEDSSSGKPNA